MHTGWKNQFNWVDFENDLGDPSILTVAKKAYRAGTNDPIRNQKFPVKIVLWDKRTSTWETLAPDSHYWILNVPDENPSEGSNPQVMTPEQEGEILLEHGQKIYIMLPPGTKYRVMEPLSEDDQKNYSTTYEGTVRNPGGDSEDLQ